MSKTLDALKKALAALERGVAIGPFEKHTTMGCLREAITGTEAQPEQCYCDEQSDPQGVLIVPPGKVEMLAATCKQSLQVESLTDCMMDLIDRLGHEAANVDARAWEHLKVYIPKEQPATEREALIARLRKLSADNPSPRDCIDEAADMLAADHKEITILRAEVDLYIGACDRRDAALAQQVAVPQEPVAWMHDADGRVDVIHNDVKALWLRVGQPNGFYREKVPCRVEHYTIPLYAAPQPPQPEPRKPLTDAEVLDEIKALLANKGGAKC